VEKACFLYGKAALADTLKKRGWDCAVSANVSTWADLLREQRHNIDTKTTKDELEEMFRSMHNLERIIANRVEVDAGQMRNLLEQSHRLMGVLEQAEGISRMGSLYELADQWLGHLENETKDLRLVSKRKLEEIQAKRRELDYEEEAIRAGLEGGMTKIKAKAAEGLLQVVQILSLREDYTN
jgi:hypothetical protein